VEVFVYFWGKNSCLIKITVESCWKITFCTS